MLLLDGATVRRLLPMAEAVARMREALAAYSGGRAVQPLRTVVGSAAGPDLLAVMPAHVGGRFGVKAVAIFPGNPARGLDTHQGTVTLFDPATGVPSAVLDAAALTEIRTAAVSAVATDLLAAPDAGRLAVLGAGVQARSHLEAMALVRRLRRIRVWSRTAAHARRLAAEAGTRFGVRVEVAPTAAEALTGADIVCTTLACTEPVVEAAMLAPGAHLNAVGACVPTARELATDVVASALIVVDSRESALAEAGDLLIPMWAGELGPDAIAAELGELLLGRHPGRTRADQLSVFESLGLAIEDVAAGAHVEAAARASGVGTEAPLA